MNDISFWGALGFALFTYAVTSFSRVHLGQCYPSDIIVTTIPTLLVLLIFYSLYWIDSKALLCPSCGDSKESYCYFGDLPGATLITRKNFELTSLNFASTMVIGIFCYIIFSITSWHPIEFWQKTPYFVPTLLAVYLFENIMLCPSETNNFMSVVAPRDDPPKNGSQRALAASIIIFSYGCTWIVNNLLGNRTGQLLSFILRTIFFFVILLQTLMSLITVRLILVDQDQKLGMNL